MRDVIIRLARPMLRLRRNERGTVGVLIAILIAGGVLLGMGALAVDAGQLYQGRAELQNVADAAALAVARSCASGGACTNAAGTTVAGGYVGGNASSLTRGTAAAGPVCGSGSLGTCTPNGTMVSCPANPAGTNVNYVDVNTSASVSPVFARTLGFGASAVKACAQAEWGGPQSANTVAFTISACTWDQATSQGTTYAQPPPYPPNPLPSPSLDQVLQLHGNGSSNGCPTEPSGADGPGNFGWTDDSGNCAVTITGTGTSYTYGGDTGTSVGQDCAAALYNDWVNKTLIFVPVYVSITGPGSNSIYKLKGFAAFVVTGYNLPGASPKSESDWLNSKNDCHGSNFCINGYFTQGLIPSVPGVGGANLGASAVALTG